MKFILLLIIVATILIKTPVALPKCDLDTAKMAIPPRIFAEVTIDGNTQNTYLTRFLHNKAGIYMSEFSRCYFNAFDLSYLMSNLGVLGLIAFLYFVYKSFLSRRIFPVALLLILPLIPFLQLPFILFVILLKAYALIGALVMIYLK